MSKSHGFQYNFFAEEWSYSCGACNKKFYTPTKNDMKYAVTKHISVESNDCLGGW